MKIALLSQTRRVRNSAGFSLIELLVVVSIIALLAAGSVGIYGKVINTITNTKAKKACTDVLGAVKQFYSEYEIFPVETGKGGDDSTVTTDDGELMRSLLGKNPDRNTKSLNYLDGMKQAKKGAEKMEDGLDYDSNPDAPILLDPWGNPYKLLLDSNFDDQIENPDSTGGGKPVRGTKAIMWSPGKDGNFETWADNVKSW